MMYPPNHLQPSSGNSKMIISVLQHDIMWANPARNAERLSGMMNTLPKADLYVLTEMWSTGFITAAENRTETDSISSLDWMKRMAREHDAAIAGSIALQEGERFYNRFYFVMPDGQSVCYDKRHLFTYGGEDLHFTRGEQRTVVEWRGVRFLLQVCYDLRFPVWCRNYWDDERQQANYDAILYVANWPTSRIEAWNTLLRARAIENQCYVVGVNRVGEDPNCKYCGCSAVIDPYGRTLVECERNKEMSAEADLDMETLAAFRKKFPVLKDADLYKIEKLKR